MRENLREQLASCNTISDFLLFWLSNSAILNHKNRFDSYYRTYLRSFTPRMQKLYQSQSLEVAERISQKKKPKLLDIGCGCGTETLWFARLGAECTGIDLDNSMIEVAQERKKIIEGLWEEKISCDFQSTSVFDLDPSEKKIRYYLDGTGFPSHRTAEKATAAPFYASQRRRRSHHFGIQRLESTDPAVPLKN